MTPEEAKARWPSYAAESMRRLRRSTARKGQIRTLPGGGICGVRGIKGCGWKRWSRRWLYDTLRLLNNYRPRRPQPKALPVR